MAEQFQTPGVYNVGANASPGAVVAVATAVPAFIGYTPRAEYRGDSYLLKPVRITSMDDFMAYFGAIDPSSPSASPTYLPPSGQYAPVYHLTRSSGAGDISLAGTAYDIGPDPGTLYYLYNSLRLFFLNGGNTAYVVSVGPYGQPVGKAQAAGEPLVNPNVQLSDLRKGLDAIRDAQEPTMLVIPDATLLDAGDHSTLMQEMLGQCGTLGSRVALLDVAAGLEPDPRHWNDDITAFRSAVGMNFLKYGVAYYPYLKATLAQSGDTDCDTAGGAAELAKVLPEASDPSVQALLASLQKPRAQRTPSDAASDTALLAASPHYAAIQAAILDKMNTLPPSGAIAGVYTQVDNNEGVWKAPANVSLTGVTNITLGISDDSQAGLNVDEVAGKSINALRLFPGQGVLVWGARTLDGNSQDWRYVNVRRTMIMVEQSIKLAASAYVFEANEPNTWAALTSALNNFLTSLWTQGALQGPTPASAFGVQVGLGTTMTAQDILEGRMNILVQVAPVHPAEFIVITYTQMMQKA